MSESIDIPQRNVATAEAELLIFVLDGSGSMQDPRTFDNRPKIEHLVSILRKLLERLARSSKSSAFRASFVYFSQNIVVEESNGRKYFSIDEAIDLLANPVAKAGGQSTAIADALAWSNDIIAEFGKDEGMPAQKHVTIFLLTDGMENVRSRDDVIAEAKSITSNILAPTIATISFGMDADEDLLKEIASPPSERQLRHLDMAQVLCHLPDEKKLFIQGHADGKISEEKAEALRSFVETLSETQQAKPGNQSS